MAHLRVPHIAAHDNSAQWDPERFLPRTGDQEELTTLLKEFRGFGGGVSMVGNSSFFGVPTDKQRPIV